jgi:DNA-binding CsgD family transcriptional regulator
VQSISANMSLNSGVDSNRTSSDDIAAVLGIRPRTVKKHLENVNAKLGVRNRTSALAWLYRVTRDAP